MTVRLFNTALILSVSVCAPHASALFCANCATFTQMAENNMSQSQSYLELIEQTVNSLQSLEYQLQNLENIGDMEWGDLQSQLHNLNSIASQGQSISYAMSDVAERFSALYVGVDGYEDESIESMNSVESYKAQGDALRDTAQSSLELANQMSEYQVEDEETLAEIQAHANSATGAMEIGQANAELLVQLSNQLQKLQTLLQAQIQMQANQMAAQSDTIERQRVALDTMLSQPLEVDADDGTDWSQEWQSPDWTTP